MKVWKRLGGALIALLALTVMLTGTALAAGPGDGGISVQLNGEAMAFTDAAPEITNDRTFLPFRAVLEAIGAEVGYDAETSTVSAKRDGVDLSMVLGQNTAAVTQDGQTRTVEMDVAAYVKNGRTYVPVRFVAEAFGCNVGWDANSRTVIIVDVETLLGGATFDLMDNFAAYCAKQEKGQNMAVTGALNLEVADKSGEYFSKPITAKGTIDGITSDTRAQLGWELKLSGPSELAADSAGSPMEQVMLQAMLSALSDMKGEVRMDLESGMLYLSLPAELTGGSGDTWYSLDFAAYQAELLSGLNMTQLTRLKEDAGVQEALTAVIGSMPLNDSETSYEALAQVTSIYVQMLSDQAFTQKGNTYVAQMKLEDVMDMTVTLTKRGNDIVAADIKATASVDEAGEKAVFTMTEHAAPDKVTVDMDMSVEDSDISMKLTLDMNCVPTTKTPVTTLPAGVQAIPMETMY